MKLSAIIITFTATVLAAPANIVQIPTRVKAPAPVKVPTPAPTPAPQQSAQVGQANWVGYAWDWGTSFCKNKV
ncbi:hypothetical protein BB559_000714 [Furculomyces boomerangus]|uniref:Uncharacterized protein n=1 Tax=Furculomyces boomerangus TaxID=61424 RepID=A0A2T9Z4G8_9FUNG|nr:hypothetical protein BB559_000714 [Furculomyces boomerangus]